MSKDLTQGGVFKQLVCFSIPIVLANLLQILFTIVDTVVVGQFVGTAGISAVSSAGTIIMLFTNFSMGVSGAGQVIISQFTGKNDKELVNKSIGTMFTFVILLSVFLTAIAIPCTPALLNLLNTPSTAWNMAADYAYCSFAGLVFIFGYSSVGAMLRGMGDSKHPLIFIGIATITNIVLDIIFVGPLKMGTFGAALATIIGQGISFLFSLGFLYRWRDAFGFDFRLKSFKMETRILGMFIRLGFPMALQHIAVNMSTMYVAACINSYGVLISALSGIGDKLRMVIAIFAASVGTAGAAMTGQNIGAGKYDRVKKIYLYSLLILLIMCAFLGSIGLIFPKTIIGMFDTNPQVLDMASKFMVINLVTYMAFALYQPFTSLINGLGYASFAFVIGLIDGVVARIGLVWFMGTFLALGYWGVWWGASLASYVGVLIGMVYFISGRWKKRNPIIYS